MVEGDNLHKRKVKTIIKKDRVREEEKRGEKRRGEERREEERKRAYRIHVPFLDILARNVRDQLLVPPHPRIVLDLRLV
jgi:hypothetical protein